MTDDIILIVEDNELLRDGLRDILKGENFNTYTASNGIEALEIMENVRPALILSDINMPEMDGFEFYNAVRAREEWLTIPFIYLTARSAIKDILTGKNLGAEDYLTKPISKGELITTVRSRLSRFRQVQVGQLQQAYIASLTALANAIEARVRYTPGHIERVTAYAMLMAKYMGLGPAEMKQLHIGAILHDIGKIHISEEILFENPTLSEDDWEQIRKHPTNGERMIKDVEDLADSAPIVRHHHERWDGNGYPDGLKGDEIPQGASIVAVADAFDTMVTPRPYRQVVPPEDAYHEIVRLSGINYDPAVVESFKSAWEDGNIQEILALM
jgi:putative two-component system response regulator